jgi:hypothetical protein
MIVAVERTLREGVAALDDAGSPYAIVGGLAVSTWAVPRATRDVDLYADLSGPLRERVEQALRAHGFHVPAMREELERFGVFRSRSSAGAFLDIFDAVGPLGEAVLARRRASTLGDLRVWVAAPEDLIVVKALSERERDFEDLVTLFAGVAPDLDLPYVERWASTLDQSIGGDDVSERVRRARERAQAKRKKRT